MSTFTVKRHTGFLLRCLRAMPSSAQAYDGNRMTIAYFCLASLDLLGTLEAGTTEQERQGWVDWVWAQQLPEGGFRGSPFTGPIPQQPSSSSAGASTESATQSERQAHLASTYTALLILSILRAPLDKLNRPGTVQFVKSCQSEEGSFSPLSVEMSAERDVRMVLCACVISELLGDWSGVDVGRASAFVEASQSYEGGFAQRPGQESQGGTTYCATVSLRLLRAARPRSKANATISWLLHRQIPVLRPASSSSAGTSDGMDAAVQVKGGGFQGRPGKRGDACYSFWCGGALQLLGAYSLVDALANQAFLLRCQSPIGGFAKAPNDRPDPFHTYLTLAALSLLQEHHSAPAGSKNGGAAALEPLGLGEMDPLINVGKSALGWWTAERARLGWGRQDGSAA